MTVITWYKINQMKKERNRKRERERNKEEKK